MKKYSRITLRQLRGDLITYFNWSANVVMSIRPGAADVFLIQHRSSIISVAQQLLRKINYVPGELYRGILLPQQVEMIRPHPRLQYVSFSIERAVAEHFADVNGFGSDILNLEHQLGKYGYVIPYTPTLEEVLFHYHFFHILPYAEAFTLLGMDGDLEVEELLQQKEVTILQPGRAIYPIHHPV